MFKQFFRMPSPKEMEKVLHDNQAEQLKLGEKIAALAKKQEDRSLSSEERFAALAEIDKLTSQIRDLEKGRKELLRTKGIM